MHEYVYSSLRITRSSGSAECGYFPWHLLISFYLSYIHSYNYYTNNKKNYGALVRQQTIPT
jgi:hypothetical protein